MKLKTIDDIEKIGREKLIDLLVGWDPVAEIDDWIAKVRKKKIPWTTKIDWNAPRHKMYFHPSGLHHKCDMKLFFDLIGEEEDRTENSHLLSVYDTGTAIHSQLQYYQETRGIYYNYDYIPEVEFWKSSDLAKELYLCGSSDGYCSRSIKVEGETLDVRMLWEYKTSNTSNFPNSRVEPIDYVMTQIHAYMAAGDIPLAVVLYYRKDDSLKRSFVVLFDRDVWNPIENRMRRIIDHKNNMTLPNKINNGGCHYCGYKKVCQPKKEKRSVWLPNRRSV